MEYVLSLRGFPRVRALRVVVKVLSPMHLQRVSGVPFFALEEERASRRILSLSLSLSIAAKGLRHLNAKLRGIASDRFLASRNGRFEFIKFRDGLSALRESAPCVRACLASLRSCEIIREKPRGKLRSRNRAESEANVQSRLCSLAPVLSSISLAPAPPYEWRLSKAEF